VGGSSHNRSGDIAVRSATPLLISKDTGCKTATK
jgi:hypothetical protein